MEGGVQVKLRACDRFSAEKEAEAEEAVGRSERGFTGGFCSQLAGGVEHLHDPTPAAAKQLTTARKMVLEANLYLRIKQSIQKLYNGES